MKNINESFETLSNEVHYDKKLLTNRVESITNYIRNNISEKFTNQYIGSHRQNTEVLLTTGEYDIDVALTFGNLSDDELLKTKTKIYSALQNYRDNLKEFPAVKWRSYALAIDFKSTKSDKNYHFDFTIYNNADKVVKGKQDETLFLENSGTLNLVKLIDELKFDQKRLFEILVRSLKHWNKQGKGKNNSMPSVVLTIEALKIIEGSNWDGSNDIIKHIRDIINSILKIGLKNWKLTTEPHDNPFERNTNNQNIEIEKRLVDFLQALDKAYSTVDSTEKYKILKDYFPKLKEPDNDRDPKDVEYARATKNQGA